MKLEITKGTTSKILAIFVRDSSKTDGSGLTGLVFNSAGLTAYYWREGDATATAITLVTMTLGTYTSSGFKEMDATNMPGWYSFCPPNAALASGANNVAFHLKGATNMVGLPIEVQLNSLDLQDAVRAGLTALPNVASGSAGAIPTTGTGSNQITVTSGQVQVQSGTGSGQVSLSSGTVTVGTNNDKTGYTVSTNNDKTGYSLAAADSPLVTSGTASAGAASTITLVSPASATASIYVGCLVKITGGTGAGQTRVITAYTTGRVATVDRAWQTNPDNTSVYAVLYTDLAATDSNLAVGVQNGTGTNQLSTSSGQVLLQNGTGTGQVNLSSGNVGVQSGTGANQVNLSSGNVGVQSGTGANQISLSSGLVTLAGVTHTGAVIPTVTTVSGNVNGSVGSVTGAVGSVTSAVTVGTNNDKTGYSLAAADSPVVTTGTASAGAGSTITLVSPASATASIYVGCLVKITSGTGSGQTRVITAYTTGRVATVDRAWQTNPDNTSVYAVIFTDQAATDASLQVAANAVNGNVTGSVASVTGAVGSVTGNVGGNVVGSVASVTAAVPVQSGTGANQINLSSGNVGVQSGTGANQVNLSSGNVGVQSGTGANQISLSSGTVTVGTNNDKTGYGLSTLESFVLASGTASAGAATTITLAGASATNSIYNGAIVKVYSGTGAGQARVITGYVGATKVATVDRAWATNPDATSLFAVLSLDLPATDANLALAANAVNGNVTGSVGSVTGSVGSVTGAVGSVTGNVGGNVVGSVASVTAAVDILQSAADKVWASTTRTLTAISTTILGAVWDALRSGHTTAGSFGEGVASVQGNVTGSVGSVTGAVGSVTGGVTVTTNNDKTGYSLAAADSPVVTSGTASAGAGSTITLVSPASATASIYVGATVKITSGTGAGQTRVITAYTTGRVATVDRAWQTNPDNTSVYAVLATDHPATDANLAVAANAVNGNVTGSVGSVTNAVTVQNGTGAGQINLSSGNVGVQSGTGANQINLSSGNVGVQSGTSANQISLSSGQVTVGTNNDKTAYALSAAGIQAIWDALTSALTTVGSIGKLLVTNIDAAISTRLASASISLSAGAVTVGTNNDKTGYGLSTLESFVVASGTASAGAATTITLAGASATNSIYNGAIVKVYGGTGAGQTRVITGYVGATKVATVDRAWQTNPDNTSTYAVLSADQAATDSSLQVAANAVNGSVTGSVASVTGDVNGNVVGSVASVTNAVKVQNGTGTGQINLASGNVGVQSGTGANQINLSGGNVGVQSGTGANQISLSSGTVTVGTNNDKTGYGLSTLESFVLASGTASAGAATTITLAGASGTNSIYVGQVVRIYGGTGAGQARVITAYVGATKVATVDRAWQTNPDSSSTYAVMGFDAPGVDGTLSVGVQNGTGTNQVSLSSGQVTVGTNNDKTGYGLSSLESFVVASGTASAGAATTITLAGASSTNSIYNGALVRIYGGTGAGQTRVITGYVGSSKVATVDRAWQTNPDNTSTYAVVSLDAPATDSNLQVTVGANNDKTGYALTSGEETAIADALLKRDMAAVSGEASHSLLNALRFIRNHWAISASTLTVYKEDGSTTAYTKTVTTSSGAAPVTAVSD